MHTEQLFPVFEAEQRNDEGYNYAPLSELARNLSEHVVNR